MTTENIEIVQKCYAQLASAEPVENASPFFSNDFRLIAGTVEVGRERFLAILTSLYAAIPDLNHTLSEIQTRGDVVQLTDHPTGTFTGHWDGSGFDLPNIPPHGSAFRMTPWKWEFTVRHGKITRLHDVTLPSATSGLRGFFLALGSTLPARASRS